GWRLRSPRAGRISRSATHSWRRRTRRATSTRSTGSPSERGCCCAWARPTQPGSSSPESTPTASPRRWSRSRSRARSPTPTRARMATPIASRWAHIALRNALLAKAHAPRDVNPIDWVAERAWLLLRMGEADAARILVSGVDTDRFTPKMVQVAVQSALANADPSSDGDSDRLALGAYRAPQRTPGEGARAARRQPDRLGRRASVAAAAHGRGRRSPDPRLRSRHRPLHPEDGPGRGPERARQRRP